MSAGTGNSFNKDDAYKNLDRVNLWIQNCDSKTSYVLAFVGIFVTVFFTSDMVEDGLKAFIEVIKDISIKDFKIFVAFITLVIFSLFVFFLIRGTLSLFNSLTATIQDPLAENSNLFFGSISKKEYEQFTNELSTIGVTELLDEINAQTYVNSKICTKKFKCYGIGIKNIKRAFLSFVGLIISIYILQLF
ncbi:hypothetical protein [Thermaerobacillus caldiproteolyticus]|uniref:hypothetical protein n=1 Tax=Thermaerobacillus caldiproteolyticus TaxID=247480 RepID=UPI00188D41B6|nr:hypothetical protein [Anoxybacillus caldiproteolyticus]QPA33390.1 hypothetical protein ISX45_19265 [Anoxybacillus caldiproteolyticus]